MVVVVAIALAVYLRTLAPTITWAHHGADGGDLITAVVTQGIPHPTGYPTYLLLGRLFLLVPWGDAARRLNLMSAVFAALTVGLLYRIVLRTFRLFGGPQEDRRARLIAGASALAFAFSPLLWSQAVISEVYTLNGFFTALTVELMLWWERGGGHWTLGAAALAFGLGLGNHLTLSLLAPALLLLLWWRRRRLLSAGTWRVAALPLLLLLGLSVYLILPWRAAHCPPVNWGDPRNWQGFRWLVSGKLYRRYLFALPLRYLPSRLLAWAALLAQQFGWWGLFLGLFGARSLWQEGRRGVVFLVTTFVSTSIYAVGYDTSDSQLYLIPAFLCFAVWVGWGAAAVIGELEQRIVPSAPRLVRTLPLCMALLLPLVQLVGNFSPIDLSSDYEARDYGVAVLEAVDPEAVLISQTDAHTFSLWYSRYAEKRRLDVAVLDGELLHQTWYRRNTARIHPRLALPAPLLAPSREEAATPSFSLTTFIEENLNQYPVYLTDPDAEMRKRYRLAVAGPVYRVVGEGGG
jgi:hypothetical protein